MKKRTPQPDEPPSELKGVIKRIKGKLTNRPDLNQQGTAEMRGKESLPSQDELRTLDPDPHRRG